MLQKNNSNIQGPEPLYLKQTRETPEIRYDSEKHVFFIKGRSIPQDHAAFYEPVLRWIDELALAPPVRIYVRVELEYFNTSSSKYLLKIFKKLEKIHQRFRNVYLEWIFEKDDFDMMDCGQDYSAILKIPFKMIEIPGE